MTYSSTTGVYTPATGAETATAGQTIASATWNSIFTDLSTALTQLGPANLGYINGAQNTRVATAAQTINFGASASDIATFSIASILPPSITTYAVDSLRIGNATGTLASVAVSLFTGAGATGSTVIGSTATTITSSVPGSVASYQIMLPASGSTVMFNNTQLFLHVTTSVATANHANVSLFIVPVY